MTESSSEYDVKCFEEAFELVNRQMAATASSCLDSLTNMSVNQQGKYFAFELGVIEYFERQFINIDIKDNDEAFCRFFNFTMYYSQRRYDSTSDLVSQYWEKIINAQTMLLERELGFNSVNNAALNPGHFPSKYLMQALGLM